MEYFEGVHRHELSASLPNDIPSSCPSLTAARTDDVRYPTRGREELKLESLY